MNSRVGQLAFPKDQNEMGMSDKPYSDATAEAMDEEARSVVDEAYKQTVALIREKKDQVESIAKLLMEKETITNDDVTDAIGARPFTGHAVYDEFVSQREATKQAKAAREEEENAEEKEEKDESQGDDDMTPGLVL